MASITCYQVYRTTRDAKAAEQVYLSEKQLSLTGTDSLHLQAENCLARRIGATGMAGRALRWAHLQGALRRLDVRNPDEYVEAEYAVAVKDFVTAASDIASHCRLA